MYSYQTINILYIYRFLTPLNLATDVFTHTHIHKRGPKKKKKREKKHNRNRSLLLALYHRFCVYFIDAFIFSDVNFCGEMICPSKKHIGRQTALVTNGVTDGLDRWKKFQATYEEVNKNTVEAKWRRGEFEKCKFCSPFLPWTIFYFI